MSFTGPTGPTGPAGSNSSIVNTGATISCGGTGTITLISNSSNSSFIAGGYVLVSSIGYFYIQSVNLISPYTITLLNNVCSPGDPAKTISPGDVIELVGPQGFTGADGLSITRQH